MPIDRRLHETFDRAADTIEPDLGRHLEAVERAAARPSGAPIGSLLFAAVVVAALLVGPGLLGRIGTGPAATAVPPSSGVVPAVAGAWSVTLDAADPGVAALGLAGDWSITLRPDGVIELVPPPGFTGSRASGHSYSLDGATLRTDLYSNDYCGSPLGSYAWSRTATALRLTAVDDGCEIRRVLLATRAWDATGR